MLTEEKVAHSIHWYIEHLIEGCC